MKRLLLLSLLIIFAIGFIIPEDHQMPVIGASSKDWNKKSFWFYPWGHNRVHKGIDIFAKAGTKVIAPTNGLVIASGKDSLGGNIVLILGSKWRFHYFAHLQESKISPFKFVQTGETIGLIGSTGNAKGKPPHLHYSIKSLFPRFWKYDRSQKKSFERMFFIDPGRFLTGQKI